MEKQTQTYRITWAGFEIEARFTPHWSQDVVHHLEIETIEPPRAALPITETGYKSHFYPVGTVAETGDEAIVKLIEWLNEEAAKPKWQAAQDAARQGELF